MDPNIALAELRKFAMGSKDEWALLFEGLDKWLMKGGFYPQDWEDAKARDLAAVRTALARKVPECSCHREHLDSHEACCGHVVVDGYGRDPNCPLHGDGSWT